MNAAQDTDTALRERALQWLAQREHSRQELQDKLIRWISAQQVVAALRARPRVTPPLPPCRDGKAQQVTDIGHAPAEPDQVAGVVDRLLDTLEQAGHLCEHLFVESRIRTRAQRHGNQRIEHELRRHGLALASDTRQALIATEYDRALQVWLRKFGTVATTPAEHARQMRFLAGRGFTAQTVRRVLKGAPEEAAAAQWLRCDTPGAD